MKSKSNEDYLRTPKLDPQFSKLDDTWDDRNFTQCNHKLLSIAIRGVERNKMGDNEKEISLEFDYKAFGYSYKYTEHLHTVREFNTTIQCDTFSNEDLRTILKKLVIQNSNMRVLPVIIKTKNLKTNDICIWMAKGEGKENPRKMVLWKVGNKKFDTLKFEQLKKAAGDLYIHDDYVCSLNVSKDRKYICV